MAALFAALPALASEIAPVATVLSSAASFANSAKNIASKPAAGPKDSLKNDKNRWLVCTVKNMTDFPVLVMAHYSNSGRYDDPPERIEPFSTMTFTCCEKDNSFMTGATGGQAFYINVDHGHQFYFGVGYCNPTMGSTKAGAYKASADEVKDIQSDKKDAQTKVAEKAYDAASEEGNKIESDYYRAKDEEGKDVVFQFEVSASAGQKTVYTISEVRDYRTVV
ncbi:hypothetical protein QFC24_006978 [Naganishia onofrii]|uniref:Uncharacterized protein n=1 Tax=Naganishia onofrii TaxID=1851511 RepID=A0ACC2WV59_9TREE|nr:hypothetical protein QFC24_006978 [Naganishia onofrii]